ncbi:MAG: RIP metalloprotease RseP [Candidatus Binataceae bacterium]
MLISIIAAVVIFALLIIVHEAGHFLVAKKLGVRVLRFSVGYPPRVWGVRRGETDYALGATPLGGYVRMLGDEISEEPSESSLEGYLHEVKLDLLGAARRSGWLQASGKSDDDAVVVMAARLCGAPPELAVSARGVAAAGGARPDEAISQIGGAVPAPQAGETLPAILNRPATDEEAFLLREVEKDGALKAAVERLAKAPSSALIELFNKRAFPHQPLAKRIAIILAGPFSNILFAPLLMMIVLMTGVPAALAVLGKVQTSLPAYGAGLRPGDRVLDVNGKQIETWGDLSDAVKESGGELLNIEVARTVNGHEETVNFKVRPNRLQEPTIYGNNAPTWIIGVSPSGAKETRYFTPLKAVPEAFKETARMAGTLCVGIWQIVDGTTPARQALGGPIMIAQIAGREARQGFADVALFTVMLSLELGVINLLPVPLLDGGHLAFFVIEGLRGKPLQLRHREIAMQVGLFLLVMLMAFVILNDISRIVG